MGGPSRYMLRHEVWGQKKMTEIERLKKKLKKANDEYHEAIDDVLCCDELYVEHKVAIAAKAHTIFKLMEEIFAFPLKEKT